MGALIDDKTLDAFLSAALADKVAAVLRCRSDGVIDRVLPIFRRIASRLLPPPYCQVLSQ
jgi:hypothetical protein